MRPELAPSCRTGSRENSRPEEVAQIGIELVVGEIGIENRDIATPSAGSMLG